MLGAGTRPVRGRHTASRSQAIRSNGSYTSRTARMTTSRSWIETRSRQSDRSAVLDARPVSSFTLTVSRPTQRVISLLANRRAIAFRSSSIEGSQRVRPDNGINRCRRLRIEGGSSLAEGVTADIEGNGYGADFLGDVRKFVKK